MMLFAAASMAAEKPAQLWLTTSNKTVLFELQPALPPFQAAPTNTGPVIDVDDRQRFQTMDGFGFALTGGSAMHLIRMQPGARGRIHRHLDGGLGIGRSFRPNELVPIPPLA